MIVSSSNVSNASDASEGRGLCWASRGDYRTVSEGVDNLA